MATIWCFQCGAGYETGAEVCAECGVGLVDEAPTPLDEVGGDDDEQLVYELHPWALEARRMLDQVLTSEGILHAWQGASLIVLAADEDHVDDVIDDVERATLPTLDPALDKVEYDMEGWSAVQQSRLSDALGLDGIPNEFDAEGRLVVHAIDEVRVDEVIDRLLRDGVGGDDDGDVLDELDGLEANDVLSGLFVAVDRLRRDPDDLKGRDALMEHGDRLIGARTPYGFDGAVWGDLRDRCEALMEAVRQGSDDDHAIVDAAGRLRDTLHGYV